MFATPSGSLNGPIRLSSRVSGFSLIELMITLVIGIILAMVAIPQYQSIIQSQKSNSYMNNLLNDMLLARSEAIKEGQYVSICISSDGATCTTPNTWDAGWIVYTNPSPSNSSSQKLTAGTSVVLRVQSAFQTGYTIATNPVGITQVTFSRDGFSNTSTGTALNALFTLTTATTNKGATRCLWIDQLGRQYGGQKSGQTAATGQTVSCT